MREDEDRPTRMTRVLGSHLGGRVAVKEGGEERIRKNFNVNSHPNYRTSCAAELSACMITAGVQ